MMNHGCTANSRRLNHLKNDKNTWGTQILGGAIENIVYRVSWLVKAPTSSKPRMNLSFVLFSH